MVITPVVFRGLKIWIKDSSALNFRFGLFQGYFRYLTVYFISVFVSPLFVSAVSDVRVNSPELKIQCTSSLFRIDTIDKNQVRLFV